MKDLDEAFNDISEERHLKIRLDKGHLFKYLLMFVVVSVSTLVIPTCGVLKSQAIMVGLLAATTFAMIDMIYPNNVYINEFHG